MKIELKIDDKNIEIQENLDNSKSKPVSMPLYDTETLHREDLMPEKYDIIPHIFYYTNNLDFGSNGYQEIEFFHNARGYYIIFMNKNVTICEEITNMDSVKTFYNRFDIYNITWEILKCDNSKKQEIIEYLTQNCYFEILPYGKSFKYPFTALNSDLFVNTKSFIRLENNETFYIKLKRTYSGSDVSSFEKLKKSLYNTILRIYLCGSWWLEKRE